MSKVEIWTLRSFLLIEQCPGPSSRCDHNSWFIRLELQRAGDSPHTKWKFSWRGTRTTDHRINAQEFYHWVILTPLPHVAKFHCLIHELLPTNHHSSLEHAIYGTSCPLFAVLNLTTCHLSNLRSINLVWSHSPLSLSLSSFFAFWGFV